MRIYISLPITGRDIEEVEADCVSAKAAIGKRGHVAVSPLELDHRDPEDYEAVIGTDITALLACDAVIFMDGWERSKGCRLEHAAAGIYGKRIFYESFLRKKKKKMDLNKLRDEAYAITCEHGWHSDEHSDEHWLMLIITEVAEAVQADRGNRHADVAKFKEYQGNSLPLSEGTRIKRFKEDFEAYIKNSVEDELADVVIRCFDLAGLRKFDLEEVESLMEMAESVKDGKGFIDFCYALSGISTCDDSTENKTIAIIAAVLKYCEFTGIDIDFFIRTKTEYNRLRPYMHGGSGY